jgi:hypothetical protein
MIVMKVGDNYRVLFDGEHLPSEIQQEELDSYLKELTDAVNVLRTFLSDAYESHELKYNILKEILNSACVDYQDGRNWKLDDIIYETEKVQEYLNTTEDTIPSYEESETIEDYGYREEWFDSGIFEKKLIDTDEREVVEELLLKGGKFLHRKRTIIWEKNGCSKGSKEILYEDMPIDGNLLRLLNNSRCMMKDLS